MPISSSLLNSLVGKTRPKPRTSHFSVRMPSTLTCVSECRRNSYSPKRHCFLWENAIWNIFVAEVPHLYKRKLNNENNSAHRSFPSDAARFSKPLVSPATNRPQIKGGQTTDDKPQTTNPPNSTQKAEISSQLTPLAS